MSNEDGVLRILKTATSLDKLNAALDVIEEFKGLESEREWIGLPFASWAKLEQLEECLRLLTGRGAEKVDDEIMLAVWKDRVAAQPEKADTPGHKNKE